MVSATRIWYKEQVNQLQQSLAAIEKQQGMKEMHNLRVNVKAIRAVLDHMTDAQITFGEAYPTLQQLYKRSGKKRDALMMRQRLQSLPAYEKKLWVVHLLDTQARAAGKKLKDYLHQHETKTSLRAECLQLQRFQPERQRMMAAWKKLGAGPKPKDPTAWHAWRKQLKQRYYLSAALNRPTNTMNNLQALQHAIGEWHDWDNAWLFLHQNRPEKPEAAYWLIKQQAAIAREEWANLIRQTAGTP